MNIKDLVKLKPWEDILIHPELYRAKPEPGEWYVHKTSVVNRSDICILHSKIYC
jgi:hypothetical protein